MQLFWREVYRKVIHLALTALLVLPYFVTLPSPLNIYNYYSLGLLAASVINSFVVKRFKLELELNTLKGELHRFADSLGEKARMPLSIIEDAIEEFHSFIEKQLSLLERDYEKREGYVGLLYGMIGATSSLLLDPLHAFYGVTALAVVDVTASLSSLILWKRGKSLGGEIIAFGTYTLFLGLMGVPLPQGMTSALLVTLTEYFSPEDNLTVPVVATVVSSLLGLPAISPS
ncbi:MAG: hypothetical protein ABWK01_05620 [Infirmifilum sp.]